MNIYQITYEPNYRVLGLHFWGCNLFCRGCYKNYRTDDLSLPGSSVEQLKDAPRAKTPAIFLTLEEVLEKTEGLAPRDIFFMGKEASLDPELPLLAARLHARHKGFHTLLTNGVKLTDLSDIDEAVFGFKSASESVHREYTGLSNLGIMNNFKKVYQNGKKLQAEIAFIPNLVEEEEIGALAKTISEIDRKILFRVTSYFAVPGAPWPTASREQVEDAAAFARKYLDDVVTMASDSRDNSWKPEVIL
ncbi:radical SAM protein [Dehalococcoides mccartyi]|uniref:radical SAM protein n=1 Tax=Dehalococcoides mccartyi TaxID=61435 RepID=UPI000750353D|nr:radical SAM protein [Dehalococcoides mccartyi]